MNVDAILPAGGRIDGAFAEAAGVGVKALAPIEGKTILQRTIEALRTSGRVGRIVVVGPEEIARDDGGRLADVVLPEGGNSSPANILRGLEWLREQGHAANRVLILMTDLPFLTPESVVRFMDACPEDRGICMPVVSKEEFEESFPGSPNTYVHLKDGDWTIGGAFLVDPAAIERNRAPIERLFWARKSQLGMARIVGWRIIALLASGRLTTAHLERRCEQILGFAGGAIRGCSPELAFDVDHIEEYLYAVERLRQAENSSPTAQP